ncbi:MAG: hypothetical protein QOH09_2820 [Pseudonocardiales bacterium]|jgi:hypothetical protein|nr:hypothetical protein [Pseudonocardiales bacterium]
MTTAPRVSFVEVGDESFPLEAARRLLACARTAADDLERDRVRATVICDDLGRALFGGLPMTATELRALADAIAAALLEVDNP